MPYYDTIVLSGGSVRCIATLGAVQYCYDNNIVRDVRVFTGASAGAIIAYLLAIGYTPIEIMIYICTHDVFEEAQYLDVMSMVNGHGAVSYSHLNELLLQMTIEKIGRTLTLKELHDLFGKTLVVSTFNWNKQSIEYKSHLSDPDLPCLIALRMSSALPMLFPPFKYMGVYYIDGGVCENFPYNAPCDVSKLKLGISIVPNSEEDKDPSEYGMVEYIFKLFAIRGNRNQKSNNEPRAKDIIEITSNVNMFNLHLSSKEKMELFSDGYRQTKQYFTAPPILTVEDAPPTAEPEDVSLDPNPTGPISPPDQADPQC